jgi:hypothetical protein
MDRREKYWWLLLIIKTILNIKAEKYKIMF